MTVEELEKLKTGDIVRSGNNELVVRVNPEDKHHWKYWEFTCNENSCLNVCIIAYSNIVRDTDLEKIKDWKVVDPEYKLSLDIKKKESELENLKKELVELTRKKMLDQIVPGNVYRFTLCGKPNIILCVRDVSEHKVYTVNLINDLWGNFYHSEVTNVELLPELTEAYKNFKTILEKA